MSAASGPWPIQSPSTEEELSELLREASAARRPVEVLGGRRLAPAGPTSPGDAPPPGTLHLSLDKLDQLYEHEPADLTATAGAGLELNRLSEPLQAAGQWLPGDAPGWRSRRVGGLVAGGRWGPLHLGYGTPRDHVLGATLVTGDGRVLELGGKVVKNVAGFDLLRLVVGSRGSLGVVARATVRLYPLPAADRTLLFSLPTPRELHAVALRLAALPASPAALEVLGSGVRALAGVGGVTRSPGVVALRLVGTDGGVEALCRLAAQRASMPPGTLLSDASSRDFFESVAGGVQGGEPWDRFSVLPSHLPELADRLAPLLERMGDTPGGWWATHVRAGIVRLVLPESLRQPLPGEPDLLRETGEWARSVGGAHRRGGAPGLTPEPPPGRVQHLMAGIRGVFDPAGVMRTLPWWHP